MSNPFEDEEPPWPEGAEPSRSGSNVRTLRGQPTASSEPAFPYTWVAQAQANFDTRPIIKGLIDPGAFVVIYGPSGSGKSFFTADIAEAVAVGESWRGRKVSGGLVVYIASEAGSSILRRFIAWREHNFSEQAMTDGLPLAIVTRGPNLLASVEVEKLIETLKHLQEEAKVPLVLVVFDTLSRSMHGGDENKAEDMTMAVNAADLIRDRFNAATVYVHHTGKDPAKGARGHSALFAAADVVMSIDNRAATVEKVRDGVTGERFAFSLEPVQIGTDTDGDPVMTCLLNADDGPAQPARAKLPTGRNQRIVLPVLRTIAAERNERSPGTSAIPKGVLMASMAEVIESALPKFGDDAKGFRSREKVKDALIGLQAAGFVGIHGDRIWLL